MADYLVAPTDKMADWRAAHLAVATAALMGLTVGSTVGTLADYLAAQMESMAGSTVGRLAEQLAVSTEKMAG